MCLRLLSCLRGSRISIYVAYTLAGRRTREGQRNEGSLNPTGNYEISVSIVDAANQNIGYAPKQDASKALMVGSKLPLGVTVQTGDNDEDAVCMWYGDQWWCSGDVDHECDFSPFDGGSRNGDCGFDCSNPYPPTSASVPIPSATASAISGSAATSASGSAPPAAATGTSGWYATGWCGVHVTQYQKNEKKVNPIGEYSLEITLADSKQQQLQHTAKLPAPQDAPISAQGPLPKPLNVTLDGVDQDSVKFTYGDQHWEFADADHHCNFGPFDGGKREGDCGFTC